MEGSTRGPRGPKKADSPKFPSGHSALKPLVEVKIHHNSKSVFTCTTLLYPLRHIWCWLLGILVQSTRANENDLNEKYVKKLFPKEQQTQELGASTQSAPYTFRSKSELT